MHTRLVVGILVAVGCIILLSGENAIAVCYPDNDNPSCAGNFDYDCDVDGTDAAVFKSHFGRSGYSEPCPSAGPAPVIWSGQMTSYATADDGDLQKGVHWEVPRFVDNGDGTLTDKATGLIWLKNANCFGQKPWAEAVANCRELASPGCGLSDGSVEGEWRLPSIRELQSVIDYSQGSPAIGFFALLLIQNLQSYYYWSSTTVTNSADFAWCVGIDFGQVNGYWKPDSFYVWPVRGGH